MVRVIDPAQRRSRKHCSEPGSSNRAVRLFHEFNRAQCFGRLGFIEVAGRRRARRVRMWTQLFETVFFDSPRKGSWIVRCGSRWRSSDDAIAIAQSPSRGPEYQSLHER